MSKKVMGEKEIGHLQSAGKFRKAFQSKRGRIFIPSAIFCLVFLIAVGFLVSRPKLVPASSPDQKLEFTYPVKTFDDGKARFYEFKSGNTNIKYFILKSSDGVIRAAFDACDVCWPEGKGYVQKGDFMVCKNCGRRFASVRVNDITGGCNPGALKREVVGDKLVIKVQDILQGTKYFTFGKRG